MIEVVEPGPLASVQDPFGRSGWRRVGVPAGGAADPWSARRANRLVGNAEGAALIEVTLGGAAFRLDRSGLVSVTGGLEARVDGRAVTPNEPHRLAAGEMIRLEPGEGARGYLAVAGGVVVENVLGSASTDLRSGFGGHDGRALRAGDRLDTGPPDGKARRWTGSLPSGPIRVVPGPHDHGLAELVEGTWTVGVEADRAGARLDGPRLPGGEVDSMGLPVGAIQVPPDGRPIVMLADRPVTGGYRVPGVVIRADIGRVAQLRTRDAVRFVLVDGLEALAAFRLVEDALNKMEAMPPEPDDGLAWAGSHD